MPRFWITLIFFLVMLILAGSGSGHPLSPGGELLYRTHCVKCHGAEGSKGKAGKNNLQLSEMGEDAIREQISEGKKGMPAFKKKLSADDITAISGYVLTLRK